MPELPQVFSVKLDPALLKRIKQARATQLECPLSESKDICPVDQPSDTLRYHSRLLKEVVSPLSNPSNSKIEFTSIGVEYEEEDDDILLRRKPDSLLENSKLAAKAAATGRKLLDLASEDSSGNSSGEDVRESSAVWDKSGNQKTKGQILSDGDSNCEQSAVICKKSSAKKPVCLEFVDLLFIIFLT
ncbi:unnamed protein product [Protopolystoma xenopodis]|uniref:Uncharacterized protein n=1 Tax=Protopolystoma xenopodis TaxID=117903 RepID=A0A448X7V3_9PLAT|nr:unnamed protein product [Protopolystoma xenopodis]